MRSYTNIPFLIVAATAALFVATTGCSDDGTTSGTGADVAATSDTSTTNDVPATSDTPGPDAVDPCENNPCLNGGTCSDSGAGTATCQCAAGFTGDNCEDVVDPCADYTCPPKADDCGADDLTFTVYGAGTCSNSDGAAKCDYAADTETACTGTEVCTPKNGCVEPIDPTTYEFSGTGSFIKSMVIGGISESVPECGFDLDGNQANGDPDKDNGLGSLAGGLGSLLGDIDLETILDDTIASGSLIILLEWVGYDGDDDDDFTVNGFYGAPQDEATWDYASAAAGNGTFTVDPSSFNTASGYPTISFPGKTTGDQMLAGPSDFGLIIPLGDISLAVTVSDTQLAGTVATDATGVSITGGELGGAVKIEELVAAINAYIDTECACLGLESGTGLIDYVDDLTKPTCNTPDPANSTCTADQDTCGMITQFCSAIFLVLAGDIDSNGNGETKYDALSVGVCAEAVGASFDALTPETP